MARVLLHALSSNVELARRQWEDGRRRLDELTRDGRRPDLLVQVDTLLDELRRRIGGSFTLQELADDYRDAERWAYDSLAEDAERPGWSAHASTVIDAAFHVYARAARDYSP